MKVAWFDGSAGASGDMLLGALVDSGVPIDVMQDAIDSLGLGIELRAEQVRRHALGATKVHVNVPEQRVLRHLPDVLQLLRRTPEPGSSRAEDVFRQLAAAEAAVHRMPVDEVHFHEVGALDCIADVVGTIAGVEHLGADRVHCSTLSLGSGRSRTEHGLIPVPVPAVLELLSNVVPVQAGAAPFESTTPTGAALLVSIVDEWGEMPPMTIDAVGAGAGSTDSPTIANLLRIVVGEAVTDGIVTNGSVADGAVTAEVQIEANVDDLDPRLWSTAIAALLDAGAADAWVTPITMKKGRPAFTVGALCRPELAEAVRAEIFRHTSTIGLREFPVTKRALARAEHTVEIEGHSVRVKTASSGGEVVNRSVEWDDVVAVAGLLGRSPKRVLAEADRLAGRLGR